MQNQSFYYNYEQEQHLATGIIKSITGGGGSTPAPVGSSTPASIAAPPPTPSTLANPTQSQEDDSRLVASQGLASTVLTTPSLDSNLDVNKKKLLGG